MKGYAPPSGQRPLFSGNGPTGEQRKRAGMAKVAANRTPDDLLVHAAWTEGMRAVSAQMELFSSDEIRGWVERHYPALAPHTPNVWSTEAKRISKEKYGENTGKFVESLRPDSHARPVRVYRSLRFRGV